MSQSVLPSNSAWEKSRSLARKGFTSVIAPVFTSRSSIPSCAASKSRLYLISESLMPSAEGTCLFVLPTFLAGCIASVDIGACSFAEALHFPPFSMVSRGFNSVSLFSFGKALLHGRGRSIVPLRYVHYIRMGLRYGWHRWQPLKPTRMARNTHHEVQSPQSSALMQRINEQLQTVRISPSKSGLRRHCNRSSASRKLRSSYRLEIG